MIIIESKKFCQLISWTIDVEAITLYPFIICKDKSNKVTINHEAIHIKQQLELLIIPFFILYILHWLLNLVLYKNSNDAYTSIIFEVEAYDNEDNLDYLKNRKLFSYWRK